jgi:LPS-assembly lipoprotein
LFHLTGGGPAAPPAYRPNITLTSSTLSMIVDINSGRPDAENFAVNANYTLQDISPAVAQVTYDTPGQARRFDRALRDAEDRAA